MKDNNIRVLLEFKEKLTHLYRMSNMSQALSSLLNVQHLTPTSRKTMIRSTMEIGKWGLGRLDTLSHC